MTAAIDAACPAVGLTQHDRETLVFLWTTGWPSQRLARHFGILESRVLQILRPAIRARQADPAAFDEAHERLTAARGITAQEGGSPHAAGLPRFADHERHVREAMAAGGFPALAEERLPDGRDALGRPTRRFRACLPVSWPVREACAAQPRRRGGLRGGGANRKPAP